MGSVIRLSRNSRLPGILLAACLCIGIFAFAYPVYVIRPFRAQGPNELAAALAVRRAAPGLTMAAALIATLTAGLWWRSFRGLALRAFAVAAVAGTVLFSALANVNTFELMFHRIDAPASISAAEAKLSGDDMVLAIRAGGQARAYPIRMMGYHHIVNDWVGGVPVAGTY